jgi:hypothetical protein
VCCVTSDIFDRETKERKKKWRILTLEKKRKKKRNGRILTLERQKFKTCFRN